MFAFNSLTDEEILAVQNEGLLPDGIYPFIVRAINPKTSSSGNPMLEVKVGILDKDGNERVITDYLVATKKMMFKLKHFCEAVGFEEEYKNGQFDPARCINKRGQTLIGVQKGNIKPDGFSFYADKNIIKDYIKPSQPAVIDVKATSGHIEFNDPVGF